MELNECYELVANDSNWDDIGLWRRKEFKLMRFILKSAGMSFWRVNKIMFKMRMYNLSLRFTKWKNS